MLNSHWLAMPFVLQMAFMGADELWFHRKRGLPRWERIGHPLDTLTVSLTIACTLWFRPTRETVPVFAALAIFSCIFVTKDEQVHNRLCTAAEQWLHAVLFMLHPVVLASAALLWPMAWNDSPGWVLPIVQSSGLERDFLTCTLALMIGFAGYQFLFWNFPWHPKKTAR
jgi:hypothetical protein